MPTKVLAKFEVEWLQILDETGKCDEKLMPKLSGEDIKKMYEYMVLARTFDTKCISLQRQGRIGTYASLLGQEASQIGSAYALEKTDWTVPSYREHGLLLVRGVPISRYLQYWSGDERGSRYGELNDLPLSIPVGTHLLHATGIGMAAKKRGDKIAVICYFGDGATSTGDFHEGMNFAGVNKAPVVIICQNNQFAISLPRARQTAAETLAQKAIAYGMRGIQIDGNDVFAVYKASKEALERARRGEGPTFIECLTYRMSDHTTSDDAGRYRTPEEVKLWAQKDPIERLQRYMESKGMWSAEYGERVQKEAEEKMKRGVEEWEKVPSPDPMDIFKYTFAEMTKKLAAQAEEMMERIRRGGRA